MRIVAMADTHTFHDELHVPDGDVLIHAGDMARAGTLEELAGVASFLRALPHRHKIVVAGNHDTAFQTEPAAARALFDGFHYLEDTEVTLDGVRIYGSPWQPAFNDWAFNLERGEALAEKWALIPEGIDVLVTHGPPRGFGDRTPDNRGEGCADLRARVLEVRPKLHLFGHIHQDRGLWRSEDVTFVNVTTWECDLPPAVLDYDQATSMTTPVQLDREPSWRLAEDVS